MSVSSLRGGSRSAMSNSSATSTYSFGGMLINHETFDKYSHVLKFAHFGDILAIDREHYVHYAFVSEVITGEDGERVELMCLHVQRADEDADYGYIHEDPLKSILADNPHNNGLKLNFSNPIPEAAILSPVKMDNQTSHASAYEINPRSEVQMNTVISVMRAMALKKDEVPYGLVRSNCEHYATGWRYGYKWCSQWIWPLNVPKNVLEQPGHFPADWDKFTPELLLKKLKSIIGTHFEFSSRRSDIRSLTDVEKKRSELDAKERDLLAKEEEMAAKELDLERKTRELEQKLLNMDQSLEMMAINSGFSSPTDLRDDDVLVLNDNSSDDDDDSELSGWTSVSKASTAAPVDP